jgi:hypothetical protein
MSFLVEFPQSEFNPDAFARFARHPTTAPSRCPSFVAGLQFWLLSKATAKKYTAGRGAWFRSTAGSISPSKPYLARMFHNIRSAYFGKAVRIKVSFFFPARARSVVMPRASRYPVDGNVLPSFAV